MGKRTPPEPDRSLEAALSAWNGRVRQSTIPLLSHCHASIRSLRKLVVLSRCYDGLAGDRFPRHAELPASLEPVRALRELASQLEAIDHAVREVSEKLASTEQTSESLARDYDSLVGLLNLESTSDGHDPVDETDRGLAEDNRLLAQLVEAQKSEIEALRGELESLRRRKGARETAEGLKSGIRGVEVHSVHDFVLNSPLADVSDRSIYYHRLLEAANSTAGEKVPMGELLTIAGLISERQLASALDFQQDGRRRPLGSLLVDLGFTNEEAIAQALAAQLSLPFVVLEREFVREGALAKVPGHLAKRHASFPLNFNDHALTIAMANPLDLIALEDLHLVSGMHIKPCVAARGEIERHITNYYL